MLFSMPYINPHPAQICVQGTGPAFLHDHRDGCGDVITSVALLYLALVNVGRKYLEYGVRSVDATIGNKVTVRVYRIPELPHCVPAKLQQIQSQ